jgi:hypothetical protein
MAKKIVELRWRDMCHTMRMFGHKHPQSLIKRQLKLHKATLVATGLYRIKL